MFNFYNVCIMSFIAPSKVNMSFVRSCYVDEDGRGKEPLVIDQSMTMKGNESDYGWPESDIQLMIKAQSQEEVAYYMSRMRDLRVNDEFNKGLSDSEIAAKVIPSNANTPVSYANAVAAAQKYFLESASSREVVVDKPVVADSVHSSDKSAPSVGDSAE